jgi:hypothetical protein
MCIVFLLFLLGGGGNTTPFSLNLKALNLKALNLKAVRAVPHLPAYSSGIYKQIKKKRDMQVLKGGLASHSGAVLVYGEHILWRTHSTLWGCFSRGSLT